MATATFTGMNLRDAIRDAKLLGCQVFKARRTGELVFRNPNGDKVRVNGRRKDAPKSLTSFLNRMTGSNAPVEIDDDIAPDEPDANELSLVNEDTFDIVPATTTVTQCVEPIAQPTTVMDRLAQFKAMRDSLQIELQDRNEELSLERTELQSQLSALDNELSEIRTQLRELGVRVDVPISSAGAKDQTLLVSLQQLILKVLSERRGIWVGSMLLKQQVRAGMTFENSSYFYATKGLRETGQVEWRGQTKATDYRIP